MTFVLARGRKPEVDFRPESESRQKRRITRRAYMNQAQEMYWGVACRTCSETIALARVVFDTEGKPIPPPLPAPYQFEAECPHGHGRETYSGVEVIMFQGLAALGFRTHPAFR